MKDDLTLIEGCKLGELFNRCPGLSGVPELCKHIREGLLTPFEVRRTVVNNNTGENCYRCTVGPDTTIFFPALDEFDRVCFAPPVDPPHLNAWVVSNSEIERLHKRFPEIGWEVPTFEKNDKLNTAKLRHDLQVSQKRITELERQLDKLLETNSTGLLCEGSRAAWGETLNVVLPVVFALTDKGTLTKEKFYTEMLAIAPNGKFNKGAFDLIWKHLPQVFKSGRGRPKKYHKIG